MTFALTGCGARPAPAAATPARPSVHDTAGLADPASPATAPRLGLVAIDVAANAQVGSIRLLVAAPVVVVRFATSQHKLAAMDMVASPGDDAYSVDLLDNGHAWSTGGWRGHLIDARATASPSSAWMEHLHGATTIGVLDGRVFALPSFERVLRSKRDIRPPSANADELLRIIDEHARTVHVDADGVYSPCAHPDMLAIGEQVVGGGM